MALLHRGAGKFPGDSTLFFPHQEGFALLGEPVFLVAHLLNAPSCPIYTEGTTKDSPAESQPTLFSGRAITLSCSSFHR